MSVGSGVCVGVRGAVVSSLRLQWDTWVNSHVLCVCALETGSILGLMTGWRIRARSLLPLTGAADVASRLWD